MVVIVEENDVIERLKLVRGLVFDLGLRYSRLRTHI
jgi:hypothetical protein